MATILIIIVQTTTLDEAWAATGFGLKDQPGQYLDILLDGRKVGRYMYAYDNSTPDRLHETYKPYVSEQSTRYQVLGLSRLRTLWRILHERNSGRPRADREVPVPYRVG
jgi:hypothetical protein